MQKKRFLAALWALTRPYWVSEKRGTGLILLATVVGLSLDAHPRRPAPASHQDPEEE